MLSQNLEEPTILEKSDSEGFLEQETDLFAA
jgi:hypothetical protein